MNQQASKKKRFNARFPPARIKKIMQLDEDVGKVAAAVPVLISRALENFVESFLRKTAEVTTIRQSRTLTPLHVKQCINADKRFAFLKDLVANVSDIQTEEEGGPSQPTTPLTPQPAGHKPFQLLRGNSVDSANLAKAKGNRRPLTVKSKSVPPPRRGLKSTTDSEEEELTPEFESDDDEDDDTDSSQGSRKRPRLGQSSSVDSIQRPTFATGGLHLPPSYCSVIKGPVNSLPHPYSFMTSKNVSAAFLSEPPPAHVQPPVPALSLKTPLPAHQTYAEMGVIQQTAVTVNVDGAQPFHIEVTLPGDNNGVKSNGVSSVAISKVACEVDDDYDA